MPITSLKTPKFSPPRDLVVSWDGWKKGLNTFARETEVAKDEVVMATNLVLIGTGVPTKRWGAHNYYMAGLSGVSNGCQFISSIKDSDDNIQVISLTNNGYLTKKNGASYTTITGVSWPSTSPLESAQLGDTVYFVCPTREMVKYNFTSLTGFAALNTPTGVTVTNLSGVTGTALYSWRVSAVARSGGETIASPYISLASIPQDLTKTLIRLTWTAVSAASGDLVGYNVYRGTTGNEVWIGGVDGNTTRFDDYGISAADPTRTAPASDTTTGYKAKFIIRYQDRLIIAGIPGDPTKVLISGRYPLHERYDWYSGGGSILIEPDSGQNITGLGVYQEKLVVFKESSVWQISLNQVTFGQYLILEPVYKLLTASQGCSSHRSIVPVENDLMFANRRGIYILRYEPQLYNIINANEISAKIKPFFDGITDDDLTNCTAIYADKKYILSYPSLKKHIVFDRERLAFMGPWETAFGIAQWHKYFDSDGVEHWIGADVGDNYITDFSDTYTDDKGDAVSTIFKTKREDAGDWTLFKTLNEIYFNFRNINGSISVNIYIEDKDGVTTTAKSFTVTGAAQGGTSGFGTDIIGLIGMGLTGNDATPGTFDSQKRALLYKSTRIVQVEVRTTGKTDNYELLNVKAILIPQPRGGSSQWNV